MVSQSIYKIAPCHVIFKSFDRFIGLTPTSWNTVSTVFKTMVDGFNTFFFLCSICLSCVGHTVVHDNHACLHSLPTQVLSLNHSHLRLHPCSPNPTEMFSVQFYHLPVQRSLVAVTLLIALFGLLELTAAGYEFLWDFSI